MSLSGTLEHKRGALTLHSDVDGARLAGADGVVGGADILAGLLPGDPGQPKQGLPRHNVAGTSAVPENAGDGLRVGGAGHLHGVALDVGVLGRRHGDQGCI